MSENDGVICKNCGAKMLLTSDTCPSCHSETPRHKYIAKVEKGIRSDKITGSVFIILLLIKLPCFVLGKLGAGLGIFETLSGIILFLMIIDGIAIILATVDSVIKQGKIRAIEKNPERVKSLS